MQKPQTTRTLILCVTVFRMKKLLTLIASAMVFLSTAEAALVVRSGGMIYDTTRNITWLADMNYAKTSGHSGVGVDAEGTMTWAAAGAWASSLVYGGFDDWRLPTLNPFDTTCRDSADPGGGLPVYYYGPGCTGGELSHLFVADLGNKDTESVLTQVGDTAEQIANLALFTQVLGNRYWSGTPFAPEPGYAWIFSADVGLQNDDQPNSRSYVVLARDGDLPSQVPAPQTLALALLALGGLAATRRRKSAAPTA